MKNSTKIIGITLNDLWLAIFVVLKLTNIINWSWWWVTAPLWIPIIIFFVFVSGMYAFYKILGYYSKNKMKNFRKNLKF